MMKKDFATMTVEQVTRYLNEGLPSTEDLSRLAKDRRAGIRRCAERYQARRQAELKEQQRLEAMLTFERSAREKGYTYIAGVDEAGRGPLAGPVLAAAVILPKDAFIPGINDSKKLTPVKREELYRQIIVKAVAWSVGVGEVTEIDSINIYRASKLAMSRAVMSLTVKPDYIMFDAMRLDNMACPQESIIGGDRRSQSIAAASIIAKVTRDRWMCEMDKAFPGYGFAEHKGYATAEHRQALQKFGPCPLHRQSFVLLPGQP